jgi:predicted phage terminase large subunit-like protein
VIQPRKAPATRKLDAALVEGFQRHYLMAGFDDPAATAPFHRTMWAEACDEANKHCAWAAPRHHAKSSAITLTFAMAAICFRFRDHVLILSDSEGQSVAQLKEIKNEFEENDELRQDFGFRTFLKETDTEIILEFADGYQVRILARGSEQRLRGMKWKGKRPNLVLGDDLEFDEIVLNPDRLAKFVDWFYKAVLHVGAKNCLFRIVGTILADNSLLARLMKDKSWVTHLWSAHKAFDDFSEILWPEKWPEADLRAERELAITAGKDDAYSQEMLNRPLADGKQLFLEDDMIDIPFAHYRDWETNPGKRPVVFYASMDFAVSEAKTADFTVITVGAVDADRNLDIVEVRKDRWGPKETIDQMFEVAEEYDIELWLVEKGTIQKSIGPFLNEEMATRNTFLSLHLMTPSKSKVFRSKSIQARHKARRVRYDHSADWWPWVKQEMTHFPRAPHDDFVDTMSQFGLALDEVITPPTEDEIEAEDWMREKAQSDGQGRNKVTGY